MEKGAEKESKDNNEYTPFHLASLNGRDDVAQFLNPFPSEPLVKVFLYFI